MDDVGGMIEIVARAIGATIGFTLLSGAVYLINDLADIERDRAHPRKKRRAIASGDLPVGMAYVFAAVAILLAGCHLAGDQRAVSVDIRCLSNLEHRLHIQAQARCDFGCDVCGIGICVACIPRDMWRLADRCLGLETGQQASTLMCRRGSTS